MKKVIPILLSLALLCGLSACAGRPNSAGETGPAASTPAITDETVRQEEPSVPDAASEPGKASVGGVLVAYFSCTGTTKALAEYAANVLEADLYEIVPAQPYTQDDLNYNNSDSRANREQGDDAARPEISGAVADMSRYDVVLVGYPIWNGQAPRIISTFLESYDLAGKTVVVFCTSHSSPVGTSDSNLHSLAPDADWKDGTRFSANATQEDIRAWLSGLELDREGGNTSMDIRITVNGTSFDASLNDSEAAKALYAMLPLSLNMSELNGNEKYFRLSETLPAADESVNAVSTGELMLYDRDTLVLFYKSFPTAYRYTPLGMIQNTVGLKEALGGGDVTVTIAAEAAIDEALEKLDIGYIDLMLLHHPGEGDVEAYKAMERAVADGKIRSIGLSNWYVEELRTFLPQITILPAVVQNEIHPYYQENDVIPYVQGLGIVMEGWYPLGGRGHTAELLGDNTISEIAKAHGVSSAQIILRWNLQKGVVVIPGSSNPEHIKENLDLFGFALTDAEMAAINALNRDEKHDWY